MTYIVSIGGIWGVKLYSNQPTASVHEVAANHNAGIGVGVVDQLWRH